MAKREKCMNVVLVRVKCMYIGKRDGLLWMGWLTAMDGMDCLVLLDEKDTEGGFYFIFFKSKI